jgi:aspartyl-tRNA(Asn)/glutamyl-tRNA(Gln) amidotransferase subunit A
LSEILFLSIAELGAAYRSGTLSPVEVVRQSLDRIAKLDAKLNSFITVLGDRAMTRAAAAERELAAGKDRGALHGVPIAIKDLVAMAGVPTTFGSRAGSPQHPASDAPVIRRLEEAGAIILGKTNLLEYAYGAVHPEFGQTNNPWNLERTSGGSSGGSAAAVAAGLCFAALGTDTGGSIRIPASYCGVAGLKPTYGLVAADGVQPLSWSLDHVGPIARSSADAARLLEGMTGQRYSAAPAVLSGLRFGVMRHPGESRFLEPEAWERFSAVLNRLVAAGAVVQPVEIPGLDRATEAVLTMIEPEASIIHRDLIKAEPEKFAAITRTQIEHGFGIPATAYVEAQRVQRDLQQRYRALFEGVDAILSPSVPWVAPAEDPALEADGGAGEMLYSGVYNLVGLPALSLPIGFGSGNLPIGLQVVTAWQRDDLALSIGAAIEALIGFRHAEPAALMRDGSREGA